MELNSSSITLAHSDLYYPTKRSSGKKPFIIAIVVISVLTVGFIIATGFLGHQVVQSSELMDAMRRELVHAKQTIEKLEERDQICMTKECVSSASVLLNAMDPKADPCEDFYQFACGGWLKTTSIPEASSRWSQFDVLREQVLDVLRDVLKAPSTMADSKPLNSSRKMYAACMDTDAIDALGLEPLTQLLESYGHWPMTFSNWTEEDFDWRNVSASIRINFGDSYLFELFNTLDSNDTDSNVIYIDQPSLGLPFTTLINAESNSTADLIQAYADYMYGAAILIRDVINGTVNDSIIADDVGNVVLFQVELAKIQTPPEGRRNKTRLYNPTNLVELQKLTNRLNVTRNSTGYINWTDYIQDIYSTVNISVSRTEKIILREPEYIKKLISLLSRTPVRVIANYIHWRLVMKTSGDTTQEMNILAFHFWKVFLGTSSSQLRWKGCVSRVTSYLGFAIGGAYIEKTFDEKAKQEVLEMIKLLKKAFKSLVDEAKWMDAETRKAALEKAEGIREFIAYPDWIHNNTKIEEAYAGIETAEDRHFDNIQGITKILVRSSLEELRQPTDRTQWISYPSVVNAYYYFFFNSITFPAGILQAPFFRSGHLAATNFGAIGTVIGHEITHGFDDQGRQTDKDGRVHSWWTNETLSRYLDGAQCFIEQYGNYTFPEFEGTEAYRINGIISQGENIADNGGIREAFRAYQNYVAVHGREPRLPGLERYTPEQIFFLSYANVWCSKMTPESLKQLILNGPHSPDSYRVRGPLSNSADFARHFQCPVGRPMNPAKKCILW